MFSTEMFAPFVTSITGYVLDIVPIGLTVFALVLGVTLIPVIIRSFVAFVNK